MHAVLRQSRFSVALCAAALAATACSATSRSPGAAPAATSAAVAPTATSVDTPTSTPTAPADASTPPPSTSTSVAGGGDGGECGTASAVAGTVLTGHADVKSFEIGAGCDITIATGFTEVGDPKAIALCEAAGKVGYAAGAKSVTVLGAENKEIAISIKGQSCIRG